jgi:hypothetical protein
MKFKLHHSFFRDSYPKPKCHLSTTLMMEPTTSRIDYDFMMFFIEIIVKGLLFVMKLVGFTMKEVKREN